MLCTPHCIVSVWIIQIQTRASFGESLSFLVGFQTGLNNILCFQQNCFVMKNITLNKNVNAASFVFAPAFHELKLKNLRAQ